MSTVTINKKDEVYLRVEAEPDVLLEMNDFFTFAVPGAQFTPQYRAKLWDGKIRLLSLFTKELYVGLTNYVEEFCKRNGYAFVNNARTIIDHGDDGSVDVFLDALNYHSNGKPVEIRDYQRNAVQEAIRSNRTLLLSPTASGKSLIIYSLVRWHQQHNRRQLIIVPTTSLVEQLYGDFADYATGSDWKASEHCTRIYSGKEKIINVPVVISTWQSIYKMPKSYFENFDVIYGDECLHPETQITMADGTHKEIQNITVGEEVETFNEDTHEYENKPVLKVHHNISKSEQMFEVLLDDGSSIKITGNHKVLLTNGIWKRVDELEIDDIISGVD